MTDPVSISASIVALLHFTATVVQYVSNVKDASESRKRLLSELSGISGLLYLLNDLAEREEWAENWPATLRSLASFNGPLDQFRQALELLAKKLAPVAGLSKAGKALAWPFEKGDVQSVLLTIERQKTLFILALQSDHIGLSHEISHTVSGLHTQVSTIGEEISHLSVEQTRQISLLQEQHTQQVLSWLSSIASGNKQNDIWRGFQQGTGEWLFGTQEIKDWLLGSSNVLWCFGIPGAGKTFLASSIIDHLERTFPQEDIGLSYLYCDYKDQSQTAVNILGSLIRKLVRRQSVIPEELEFSYKSHTSKHTRPSVTEYATILRNMAKGFARVFIVVDALDEVMEQDGTRDTLMTVLNGLGSNTQLLVTSRWVPNLEREFCTASRLEIRANDSDVAIYVQSQVDNRPRLRAHVRRDQSLRELIVEKIVENCKGMFLLARLHIDSLTNTAHPKAVKLALAQLPVTLNNTYNEIMKRIERQEVNDIRLAHQILSWIVSSFRPLTVDELQHALATEHNNSDIEGDAIIDEELMLSVCSGLVAIEENSRTMRLVHYTAQEYFEIAKLDHVPDANSTITDTCLLYLSFDPVRQSCSSDAELEVKLQHHAFVDYAAKNWGHHAAICNESVIQDSVIDLLSDTARVSAATQIMFLPAVRNPGYSQRVVRNVHGLHLAAYFGLTASTGALLATGPVQPNDGDGRVPLHWAAKWGHLEVTRILLDAGTDPNARDNGEVTALHLAASYNQQEVLKLLLDRQADVNARNNTGGTALHWAATQSLETVASILLQHDAQTELRTEPGNTPLLIATKNNDSEIVRLLIKYEADVESCDEAGRTPLHQAVLRSQRMTNLLLESGAHCEARDRRDWTPLHLAAKGGNGETVRLLLDHGADAEAKNYRGRTALHYAAEKSDTKTILALLPVARLERRDKYEATALHFAASSKRGDARGNEAVQLLLETGRLDVNAQDTDGRSALHCAAQVGHANTMKTLLTHGGDPALKDTGGATVLDVARDAGQEAVLELLR